MEEGGEEEVEEEELGELTEEERAEYETLNRQLDQLDKVLDTLNTLARSRSLSYFLLWTGIVDLISRAVMRIRVV